MQKISVSWMGACSTIVLCTALSLLSGICDHHTGALFQTPNVERKYELAERIYLAHHDV